jgi:hypothetical protein
VAILIHNKYTNILDSLLDAVDRASDAEKVVVVVQHVKHPFGTGHSSRDIDTYLSSKGIDSTGRVGLLDLTSLKPDVIFAQLPNDMHMPNDHSRRCPLSRLVQQGATSKHAHHDRKEWARARPPCRLVVEVLDMRSAVE